MKTQRAFSPEDISSRRSSCLHDTHYASHIVDASSRGWEIWYSHVVIFIIVLLPSGLMPYALSLLVAFAVVYCYFPSFTEIFSSCHAADIYAAKAQSHMLRHYVIIWLRPLNWYFFHVLEPASLKSDIQLRWFILHTFFILTICFFSSFDRHIHIFFLHT
jgi:hypothetical protein